MFNLLTPHFTEYIIYSYCTISNYSAVTRHADDFWPRIFFLSWFIWFFIYLFKKVTWLPNNSKWYSTSTVLCANLLLENRFFSRHWQGRPIEPACNNQGNQSSGGIEVDLTCLIIDSFSSAETRRNCIICIGHWYWLSVGNGQTVRVIGSSQTRVLHLAGRTPRVRWSWGGGEYRWVF